MRASPMCVCMCVSQPMVVSSQVSHPGAAVTSHCPPPSVVGVRRASAAAAPANLGTSPQHQEMGVHSAPLGNEYR